MKRLLAPAFLVFAVGFLLSLLAGWFVPPVWQVEAAQLDAYRNDDGELVTVQRGDEVVLAPVIPVNESQLWPRVGAAGREVPTEAAEIVRVRANEPMPQGGPVDFELEGFVSEAGETGVAYFRLTPRRHWGLFSLLPAAVAITLCFVTREPLTALAGAVVSGAMLTGAYDVTGEVLIPALSSSTAATVLVLYLWFLGGLLGIWSSTGAARAFAHWATATFVRGPSSAKLVSWVLGALFFQGGTLSTVLVGTTVRPIADKQRVSHEELSYVVDSTASPIAILLPFNAWPLYVAGLIYVGGVDFLSSANERVGFFFASIPLNFYAILAVFFTLLLAFDKLPFMGKSFKAATRRARDTGELNAPDAEPLAASELEEDLVAEGYRPSLAEFLIPLGLIIGVTVFTYAALGSPNVLWGFALGLLSAFGIALWKGMKLETLIGGFTRGLKGVVYGSAILLLAVVVGGISKEAGGGLFLVELLSGAVPFWLLPLLLQVATMIIAFSTGTSWGTYAVTFPLAMPLAWAIGADLSNPELYLLVCFAAVLNGSVYGDQCSPISDTTVLSSMATGCDLMDHVRTQIYPASIAAGIAAVGWAVMAFVAG